MIISEEKKFIFLSSPKTASSSIRAILVKHNSVRRMGFVHNNTNHVFRLIKHRKENWADYFSFSFCRNPWDKAVSEYFYVKRRTFSKIRSRRVHSRAELSRKRLDEKEGKEMPSFTRWVKEFDLWTPFTAHGASQVYFLNPRKLSFIGRFENLQEDFDTACDKIGIPQQQLPHRNKTEHDHYSKYYTDETRQIVADKYARDIAQLGYEFEEE